MYCSLCRHNKFCPNKSKNKKGEGENKPPVDCPEPILAMEAGPK